MKILKIALVTVAIQSTAAVTFIQKDSNAQGAMPEPASLETATADTLLVALSESHDTSQTVQEVLQDNGNVEDYNTVTQVPPILDSGIVHHAAELVELAVHDDDSAGSSLNLAVSKNAKGPLDMDLWKQSLGRALELAKVKAGELQEKQVALDIKQWVEDHPWRGQSYVANRETMKATFDMNFWGQSLGEALELAKIKARELHLDQVAMDIERWVEQHPWQAAFYTASFLGFFAPEILSIPALEALGFGLAGVRAGTSALLRHWTYCKAPSELIPLYRIDCRQSSIRDRTCCRPERFRNLAECTHGRLRGGQCEWWGTGIDRPDGCCGGSMQSSCGLQRLDKR